MGKSCWRRNRLPTPVFLGFPSSSDGKESAHNEGDVGSIPGLGRSPWKRERLPISVFWPREFHGLYSLPSSSVHGIIQAIILEWVAISFSRGIFPTQGLNPGLLHWRQTFYHLSHQGSPRILEWVAYPFSRGSSQPRNRTGVSCIAGRATRESFNQCVRYQI